MKISSGIKEILEAELFFVIITGLISLANKSFLPLILGILFVPAILPFYILEMRHPKIYSFVQFSLFIFLVSLLIFTFLS